MDTSTLIQIESESLNDEGWKKTSPLDAATVLAWMSNSDWEVMGATHRLLFVKEHLSRVSPQLSFFEIVQFRKRYYERCIQDHSFHGGDWEWVDSPMEASHFAVYWFYELWKDKTVPRSALVELKIWLQRLLTESGPNSCLQSAMYDHLLCHSKINEFFSLENESAVAQSGPP